MLTGGDSRRRPVSSTAQGPVLEEGRCRVVIAAVSPEIDAGRFPIKRTVGEPVEVTADIFLDGAEQIAAVLRFRREADSRWEETPMVPLANDRWRATFIPLELGRYVYTLAAWIDRFRSWRSALLKKAAAKLNVTVELQAGMQLVAAAAERARAEDAQRLREWASRLDPGRDLAAALQAAQDERLAALLDRYPDRRWATNYSRALPLVVDRDRARFGAWYEIFPRSCASEPRHGTLKDCEARLPYIASMGFDVLYLTPIHPIGRTGRRGRNCSPTAGPDDPGSPWAIGGDGGGHKAIHPTLGTLADFRSLQRKAAELGLELALDLAFQCSPDNPWVQQHPDWFSWRPDGTVQCAENPPKVYPDIYPLDFESESWLRLWEELRGVVQFWIEEGIRIFRVDNPHTKPFRFWEWLIGEIKLQHPEVIFLSEAFTRPKVMQRLAKLGFTQSYTYFTWRNTKDELMRYVGELTQGEVAQYLRASLWPNTPDILPEYLQTGGRPAFVIRLVLAATLGASYGIYGPAFELCENRALEPGSEEYLDSEKYQIRCWDLDRPDSLVPLISRVNRIRREHPALQSDRSLRFHHIDNDQLICYSKLSADHGDLILVVVNLDPHNAQSGWLELEPERLGMTPDRPLQVHELLGDSHHLWHGARQYLMLSPQLSPAFIFHVRSTLRTERDFEYYM